MQSHKPRNTPSSGRGLAKTRQKPVVQRPPKSPPRRKAFFASSASRKGRAAAERRACTPAALPSRRPALGNRPLSAAAVPTACRSSLSSGLFLVPFPMALKRACTSAFRAKKDVPRKGTSLFAAVIRVPRPAASSAQSRAPRRRCRRCCARRPATRGSAPPRPHRSSRRPRTPICTAAQR